MRRVIILLFICHVAFVFCGKTFRLGRSKGGNLGEPLGYNGESLPQEQWFYQKLDHFTPTDLRTWKQRYYINDTFFNYKHPGPIFLMIGGEGPASPKWMVQGAWIDYARKFKAMCIQVEHRYYGKSHPTEDLSTKNLQYLSSAQALADLANFIGSMNDKFKFHTEVPWVAFGGSYSGSLAAWLRMKYPHLVHAAVSSSGPLLAKVNFIEYFQVALDAIREKSPKDCVSALRSAHAQIVALMVNKQDVVEKLFRVCKPFKDASTNDIKNFYNSLADDVADLVQYNEDNRIGADEKYRNVTITSVCDMLTSSSEKEPYEKFAEFNAIMLDKSKEPCLDYSYDNMISEMRNVSWNGEGSEGGRQWFYQTCTEFGFYQTPSQSDFDVFGDLFDLDFFIQQCQDIFGPKFNKDFITAGVEWSNKYYGGRDISVSRVVFVHGSVDPWHALGLLRGEQLAPAIYIHGTAHCADMYPAASTDEAELTRARGEVLQFLDQWLM